MWLSVFYIYACRQLIAHFLMSEACGAVILKQTKNYCPLAQRSVVCADWVSVSFLLMIVIYVGK